MSASSSISVACDAPGCRARKTHPVVWSANEITALKALRDRCRHEGLYCHADTGEPLAKLSKLTDLCPAHAGNEGGA